jgi:hypothetical protein
MPSDIPLHIKLQIAAWFLQRIKGCESVRVYDNDECWRK